MKDLSLHVLDLLANSTVVGSTKIDININDSIKDNCYCFEIIDNGCGMSEELLAKVTDPYTTTRSTRKVGLGLPLIKMNAEHCNGGFEIKSKVGEGTALRFWFEHNNIDRPPLGDIAGAVVFTAAMSEQIRFIYTHTTDCGQYVFDTDEIKEALDGISLSNADVIRALCELINANLAEIGCNQ
ncbi:MAG: ATP-binding protein [Bacteroidales bacterium]|jgi:hypothetical protein|nr:ATP-binding protein [Bacteroidales bacterium]